MKPSTNHRRSAMTKHHVAYASSEKQRRYSEAVGPNKLFGTGEAVVKCFRILAAGGPVMSGIGPVDEVLDVLASGMVAALDDSFETPTED
tara:strand:- start:263 stop:532 length:270 start_codon:yes stop_codon:yes gene_type:complete